VKINEAMSSLIATFHDWDHILVNPNFVRKEYTISWETFVHQRHPDIIYRDYISELENSRQYSFQVIDGSIFQLYYDYQKDGTNLRGASLAFFNIGELKGIFDESLNDDEQSENSKFITKNIGDAEELELRLTGNLASLSFDSIFSDMPLDNNITNFDNSLVPWLRIDYAPNEQMGPLHHSCHMHIGLFYHARIALSCVPTPRQFIEFVISLCYPDEYKEKRLDPSKNFEPLDLDSMKNYNIPCFQSTNGCAMEILPYIRIPTR